MGKLGASQYLGAGMLLAGEFVARPAWAFYYLLGFIDEHYLLRFYQKRRAQQWQHLRPLEEVISQICHLGVPESRHLLMTAATAIQRANGAPPGSPIPALWDGSQQLQQLAYCLTRCLQPETVVEIGVARGATTRSILTALQENGQGHLYSIELPPLGRGYTAAVGHLVPPELRSRWTLLWGPSQQQLPRLLRQTGPIGLLIHDGAHSYHTQKVDYQHAAASLRPGGVLVTDDVNNDSFADVADAYGLSWALIEQPGKDYPIGVACKP